MNIKEIMTIVGDNKSQNEQISLPFIAQDGDDYLTVFTFDSYDDSEESMKITTIFRKFIFNLKSNMFEIEQINDKNAKDVKFDQLYDIDELDKLYEVYYNNIDKYLKQEISYQELTDSMKKIVSESFLKIYEQIAEKKEEVQASHETEEEVVEEKELEKAHGN